MPLSRHDRRLPGKWFRHVLIATGRGSKHLLRTITTYDGPRNFFAGPFESGRRWKWKFLSKAEDRLITATLSSSTEFQASDSVGREVRPKKLACLLQKVWQQHFLVHWPCICCNTQTYSPLIHYVQLSLHILVKLLPILWFQASTAV